MPDETNATPEKDGDRVNDTETKEAKETKSVSFNRDVHVKRFGKPRESRGASIEQTRKEPFTHLSKEELIEEANKVRAQAESVTCTTDHPPEKFYSLPHRRKFKEDKLGRRNSDDGAEPQKTPLGRSTSDVSPKKKKERTSLSTLFRRAQRTKSPDAPVVVTAKPVAIVKRSKSDVSDLKSNTNLSSQSKPIRKRSGSETEEFLKSLRNKKSQLSPIIESSPREDYFKKTPPLDLFQKQKLSKRDTNKSEEQNSCSESKKVNPIEKPPRYKTPEKQEPKPPTRSKRGKSLDKEKEQSPSIKETPKRKTEVKKTLLVDEIDSIKAKDINPVELKDRIKESIRKIEENVYGSKEMIHSSQQPPDKPPLTRGHTVDHIIRILKEDQSSPPPKSHLISPTNGTNVNQPFSYIKPSVSPDPNLFVRSTSPDRPPSPVNKMMDKGVVYAQVVRDNGDSGNQKNGKQTIHKTYSPSRDKLGNFSDEDEGLGYEERYKNSLNRFDYSPTFKNDNQNYNSIEGYNITDSPIRPRYREYKLKSFDDFEPEPTYANEYPSHKDKSHDFIDSYRGRGDGMDTKKKYYETENKVDLDFNELSHRRKLLESRINARRIDLSERIDRSDRIIKSEEPRYLAEPDPIYEAEKRRKATEKYVNETARYYRQTLERDGFAESSLTEDYSRYDSDNQKIKSVSRTFEKVPKGEIDRREYIDRLGPDLKYKKEKDFPPEPEYEPPSLEFTPKAVMPDEYKEKKYKVKKNFASSQDAAHSGHQKYKIKDSWFGKRKGHYASNPEIAQEREEEYANIRSEAKHVESYHNSLRRTKNKEKYHKEDFGIRRHGSGDSGGYYRDDKSPRRYDIDNRLVDSGIENDFRKDSSGELHRSRYRIHESDDDVRDISLFLASERRHTEDNYPSEQIYANGEYMARFKEYKGDGYRKEYSRDRSIDGISPLGHKGNRFDKSPSGHDDKVSAKPPKATKKLSGLEKMKQLFSRDSSKKSKKEKEVVQPKTRTRVLKSPKYLARHDSEYRRYTDPEPSDIIVRKIDYDCQADERRYRGSKESLDKYRGERETPDRTREKEFDGRYDRTLKEDRHYKDHVERRFYTPDRDSDQHSRPSDVESELRKSRSRTAGSRSALDSPALAERYRERRRLATPSPTPSPPRRPAPQPTSAGNWFKSLDRLTSRKRASGKNTKVEKESILTTEHETPRKPWSKPTKPLNSPAKNLRFFGDTDQDSDANVKPSIKKNHAKSHGTLRKTISNSSTGLDEVDHSELSSKSYSLSNLHREEKSESPRNRYYKRNLQNISENHSNSETESQFDRQTNKKPPMSPYGRSRSRSSSATLKADLRGSKQELARDFNERRRVAPAASGASSTEGESSHPSQHSQRSVVYLHATTVGEIPDARRNDACARSGASFSLAAAWGPRHARPRRRDLHYEQRPRKPKAKEFNKTSSIKNSSEERPSLQKNKSYSQTTLTRRPRENDRLTSSSTTLYRKPDKRRDVDQNTTLTRKSVTRDRKSQSSEILNRDHRDKVSRSISMPKDNNKKAGWFKLSNKNKKQEINTRVR
ncbi:uncharacterized protein blo [Plodia interpunctella]|uniref:uncharacterized protein blo n=1 Tax=Plodia interpunctella TaxID=58824 RepID=UPI002367C57B|nr:uncharacterized protein LOC128679566 [Plodia interpunctella]XP_053617861.1 uncharacterized protein LOC128679566 [Plodia interpunctella]XP_053617862.1 uncharacterized protein LOC128679566 [Plodia interpunctella]